LVVQYVARAGAYGVHRFRLVIAVCAVLGHARGTAPFKRASSLLA
jgi:hypothetical protein